MSSMPVTMRSAASRRMGVSQAFKADTTLLKIVHDLYKVG